MIILAALADIEANAHVFSQPIQEYLRKRIVRLHENYCSDGLPPVEQFSLSDFGSILWVESGHEIEKMVFESVSQMVIDQKVYYLCSWVPNNEICCDIIIAQETLNDLQRQQMEEEID